MATKMSVYPRTFTVQGKGEFPVDMLRYDRCWPADPESAARIHRAHRDEDHYKHVRNVKLNCYTERALQEPATIGRWNSFMWAVIEVDGHTV